MKLETILNELRNANDNVNELKKLELKLIESIKKETIKESGGSVKRYNAAKKLLNDKVSKSRPILQTVKIENDTQRFTNSYVAFMLKGKNIIQGLPETDPEATYPSFDKLIPNHESKRLFNKKDIIKAIKTSKEFILLQLDIDTHVYIDKKYMQFMLDIMILDNDFIIHYKKNSTFRPLIIKNDNNDTCILMPVKREETDPTNEIQIVNAIN